MVVEIVVEIEGEALEMGKRLDERAKVVQAGKSAVLLVRNLQLANLQRSRAERRYHGLDLDVGMLFDEGEVEGDAGEEWKLLDKGLEEHRSRDCLAIYESFGGGHATFERLVDGSTQPDVLDEACVRGSEGRDEVVDRAVGRVDEVQFLQRGSATTFVVNGRGARSTGTGESSPRSPD